MANFPIPTSGTAWASGGISGRVGVKGMKRAPRRSRFGKKPWESTNWIPYVGNFNLQPWDHTGAVTDLQIDNCADQKRIVEYAPSLMNQDTLTPTSTGRVATEQAIKVRRIQGHVHFDGQIYRSQTFVPEGDENQYGVDITLWYSWQKESTTTSGYDINISDVGIGPGVLSGVKQLTSRKLLSWGRIDWTRPHYSGSNGIMTGDSKGDRSYVIPNPRLPPGGLKLGIGEALTLIVRAEYGLPWGRDASSDATNSVALPIRLMFYPFMRFLVSA